jgi:hypothetical protein
MLYFIQGNLTPRNLRLFACDCVRLMWDSVDEEGRVCVDLAERFADGIIDREFLEAELALLPIPAPITEGGLFARRVASGVDSLIVAAQVSNAVGQSGGGSPSRHQAICNLLRDMVLHPACAVAFDPAWLTGPVPDLAEAAYENRDLPAGTLDPARLAVLADALEDNGAGADVLDHLRASGPHVRGCWAVDLCTGRE